VNTKTDQELAGAYALENSEEAFTELVRRHVHLVYSVALRLVHGDEAAAKDVTQSVFVDLAKTAKHPGRKMLQNVGSSASEALTRAPAVPDYRPIARSRACARPCAQAEPEKAD
jgi:hypothetical protein